ncbi:MAG TPA: hypothetical protein VJM57_02080, partial [Thermodesulfobacteriota bacterium]|nr:hypothetical protein [Thermodesulfobacteriota bacterium]
MLLIIILFGPVSIGCAGWNFGAPVGKYPHKGLRTITITGTTAGAQTDYPLFITVPYYPDMLPDYADVRLKDADGNN